MLILTDDPIDPGELATRTGWEIKPEGACKGDTCVPLPEGPTTAETLAGRLGMPLISDDKHNVSALGPATLTGKAIDSVRVPSLTLQNFEGQHIALADVRGTRTVVVSWAPW